MSKAVLISIRPKWCELIANDKKTIEVRKSRPKIATPFRCYIYCTKDRHLTFYRGKQHCYADDHTQNAFDIPCNGAIIGEFVCDSIDTYDDDTIFSFRHEDYARWNDFDLDRACIHPEDFQNYSDGEWLYGWHISGLKIYDKPLNLSEFCVQDEAAIRACGYRFRAGQPEYVARNGGWLQGGFGCVKSRYPEWCENCLTKPLTSPPQSWRYVEALQEYETR